MFATRGQRNEVLNNIENHHLAFVLQLEYIVLFGLLFLLRRHFFLPG